VNLPHINSEDSAVFTEVGDQEGDGDCGDNHSAQNAYSEFGFSVEGDDDQGCNQEVMHVASNVPRLEHALKK